MDSSAGLIPHVNSFIYGCHYSGILVPGGFGIRGTEGKLQAISWARTKKKPFLGKIITGKNPSPPLLGKDPVLGKYV